MKSILLFVLISSSSFAAPGSGGRLETLIRNQDVKYPPAGGPIPASNEGNYQWDIKGDTGILWRKDGTYAIRGKRKGKELLEYTEAQVEFRDDNTTPVIGEHVKFQEGKAKSVVACTLNPDVERMQAERKKNPKRFEKPTPGNKAPDYQVADCITVTDDICKTLEEYKIHDPNADADEDEGRFKEIGGACIDLLLMVEGANRESDIFKKIDRVALSKTQKDGFASIQKLYGEKISEGAAQVKYHTPDKVRSDAVINSTIALGTLVGAAEMCGRLDRFNRPAGPPASSKQKILKSGNSESAI